MYGYWDETLLQGADLAMWHRILVGGRFHNLAFLPEPTSLHFVAGWRQTAAYRRRMRVVGWLLDDFIEQALPAALRVPVREGETQQESAWRYLSEDPDHRMREIRRAVVQLQDAFLCQGRTVSGLIGLRVGSAVGTMLDRLWDGLRRTSSPS